ncbi:putative transcription factor 19-like [Scophthalmus maximus]|uniref:Putative transcription factor 19-like n=1 Tax=Scophthalmus maximus TaxID=52904 RepID=A0A2U9CXD6_SCOMX|nr:putative transcription factor 19-like [Scophthalmus maximus]
MVSGVQPCFQLLRIGAASGDQARDLYTFRPALSHCVFRLGRAAEVCDVTLDSPSVSRIHAELHAEREASGGGAAASPQEEGWSVHVKDRSSHVIVEEREAETHPLTGNDCEFHLNASE